MRFVRSSPRLRASLNVAGDNESLPPYDAHLPLLSLPRVLSTTGATIPAKVPYIIAPPDRRAEMRARLDAQVGLKVGLAWAGNREHANDRNRSCPLAALGPLFGLPGIAWFSLQQGAASADIATVSGAQRLVPLPAGAVLADTAALIAELDLVITVDTSIAHLAGALGQPTWVLLPFAPDWRWLLERSDSPWYPTVRLFRQPRPRDWSAVAIGVVEVLRALQVLRALVTPDRRSRRLIARAQRVPERRSRSLATGRRGDRGGAVPESARCLGHGRGRVDAPRDHSAASRSGGGRVCAASCDQPGLALR